MEPHLTASSIAGLSRATHRADESHVDSTRSEPQLTARSISADTSRKTWSSEIRVPTSPASLDAPRSSGHAQVKSHDPLDPAFCEAFGELDESSAESLSHRDPSFEFVASSKLYQVNEIRGFAKALTRECLTEHSFAEDLKSGGEEFDPWRLSGTLHRVEFWREILELSLYKRSLRDLVIRGEAGIKTLDEIDNFYAQVSSSGHELLLNLALSELFHLPVHFDSSISAVVQSRCRSIMKSAVGALQRDYHYHTASQKFVGPDGKEVDIETLVPFRSRYRAECRPLAGETLTKRERKLLAAYRVLGKEIGRLKQEIALLRAVTEVEEHLPPRAVDAALDKVAGVTQHLSDIEPNRLALRYYLHRRVRDGMRDLARGLKKVERVANAVPLQSTEWIKKSNLSFSERARLGYLHLRHGQYGSLVTKFAVGQALFMLAVGLTQFAGQHLPGLLDFVRGVPALGSVFRVAEQPVTKLAATIILLGAIDLIPNAIIKWQSKKLSKYLK